MTHFAGRPPTRCAAFSAVLLLALSGCAARHPGAAELAAADAHLRSGRYAEAAAGYQALRSVAGLEPTLLYRLALVALLADGVQGDGGEVRRLLEQLVGGYPASAEAPSARALLGLLAERDSLRDRRELLERQLEELRRIDLGPG